MPMALAILCRQWSAGCTWQNFNILRQSLKPLTILLFNGDSYVPRFAGFDVMNRSGFTGVCAANDTTKITVLQFVFR